MYDWLQRVWYANAASGVVLRPLALDLRRLAVRVRRWLYAHGWAHSIAVARPVIVVGNLTVGGTGKTPLVLWLAARLRERGLRPGIVLRGYRSGARASRRVSAAASASDVGDEAALLAARSGCPVAAGADRIADARLLEAEVDVILADDGLQHLRLRRELEIVVIDGERRFGNRRLLPAGPLREPLDRLESVDAVVVNGGTDRRRWTEDVAHWRRSGLACERRTARAVHVRTRPGARTRRHRQPGAFLCDVAAAGA